MQTLHRTYSENLCLRFGDKTIGGRFFKQTYRATVGKPAGWYADRSVAAVENHFGQGRPVLMGSFPGAAHFRKPTNETRIILQSLIPRKQRIAVSSPGVVARLHEGAGGSYLWVVNPAAKAQDVTVVVDGGHWSTAKDLWSGAAVKVSLNSFRLSIPAKDAAVLQLGAAP
jgi:beta-galactosidase